MWYAATLVAMLTLTGCVEDAAPPAPVAPIVPVAPQAPIPGPVLWGMVVDRDGGCITGATVRVVRGETPGDSVLQQTPCNYWDELGGFVLRQLPYGMAATLRASAPGYAPREVTVVPACCPMELIVIELARE